MGVPNVTSRCDSIVIHSLRRARAKAPTASSLKSSHLRLNLNPLPSPVTRDQIMSFPSAPQDSPAPQLGLWDVVSIIVGIIVGATIYRSPALIFGNVTDQTIDFWRWSVTVPAVWAGLGAWVLVGVLSLIGAMCYAELAT